MVRRDDFLIGSKEKAAEAIKSGNTEEALRYLNDVYEQFHRRHDSYCDKSSFYEGLLAEAHGEEWLEELNRSRVTEEYRPIFERFKNMTPEQRVGTICNWMRAHYSEFYVEEDDEKFVVALTGCNAGGRLMRDGIAKRQKSVTRKAYPWSFNRVGFPYYCVHVYIFNELWKELGIHMEVQWGRQYDDLGNKIDEPCKYIVYKS